MATRKPAGGKPSAREKIERDIAAALPDIDEEGLLFLLRQAQVLVHNARVERLAAARPPAADGPGEGKAAAAAGVLIEDEGSTIFVTLGKVRKVMSPVEMKRLVRICWGAETRSDALRQLFAVLRAERSDILADAGIGAATHPLVAGLFDAVRATWRLADR